MTRIALDTNVLIYAEFERGTPKGIRARDVFRRAAKDGVLPCQVIGEFLNYVHRRRPTLLEQAIDWTNEFALAFRFLETTPDIVRSAGLLASRHQIQFWDGVICAASMAAGARALLTEDMQDGRMLEGLRLINPFNPANTSLIETLLPP